MSTEESRAEFEAYYTHYVAADAWLDRYDDPETLGRWYYASPVIDAAWHMWQTARSTAPAPEEGEIGEVAGDVELARLFHDKYEALAPVYGYETRTETREFDPQSKNGRLMVAVVRAIRRGL